jgi:hypothetical protein
MVKLHRVDYDLFKFKFIGTGIEIVPQALINDPTWIYTIQLNLKVEKGS